ncbi:hypothetical protein [Planctomicrobium piriforme]|uniref:Uncharacterized protein n=1 Tax=Planctomicrobium piriforme TaxID=1576369 RepID=A0A1I3JX79_9PLAN|nr:hypothetical protein [Planctomicrobium piriforme]SFI64680.1 hypothetical protein SAMN05421753_11140 [Planctomicrobium piriforme]
MRINDRKARGDLCSWLTHGASIDELAEWYSLLLTESQVSVYLQDLDSSVTESKIYHNGVPRDPAVQLSLFVGTGEGA